MGHTLEEPSSTCETVGLSGEIDLANASALGDDLCRAIHGVNGELVVDLSQVTFVDSSAIAMMIRVHQYAEIRGTAVTWRSVQSVPARALEITGVNGVLKLAP